MDQLLESYKAKLTEQARREYEIEMVAKNYNAFEYIQDPSDEVCIVALAKQPYNHKYRYGSKINDTILEGALKRNGMVLGHYMQLANQKLCDIAFKQNIESFQYIPAEFQTDEMIKEVMEKGSALFGHIDKNKLTTEMCLEAVKKDPFAIVNIDKQTVEICLAAVQKTGLTLQYIKEQTPLICLTAVNNNPSSIRLVKEDILTLLPSLVMTAVKLDGNAIGSIDSKYITYDLCLAAVEQTGIALAYIPQKFKTDELCKKAVQQNGWALSAIPSDKRTDELNMIAVKQNGLALQWVPTQTLELVKEAYKQTEKVIPHINHAILNQLVKLALSS